MKTNFRLSWLLIGISIPLLGMLAFSQFIWLETRQKQENLRIEYSMMSEAQSFTQTFQEEILFLPTILRIQIKDTTDLNAVFSERLNFWHYYTLMPDILKHLYYINDATNIVLEWTDSGLETTPRNTILDTRDTEKPEDLRFSLPVFGSEKHQNRILCILDRNTLMKELLPAIATEKLKPDSMFSYAIVDIHTGDILYRSDVPANFGEIKVNGKEEIAHNAKPDLTIPLTDGQNMEDKRKFPDISFTFIPDTIKEDPIRPPEDSISLFFSDIQIQIVNKNGSLEKISRRATIQNASLSFVVVFLIVLLMSVLARATTRSDALARSQREFIATITHELKTPLAVITGAAQNLADGLIQNPAKIAQYGTLINGEASRLAISVEHFLLYSNINTVSRMKPIPCEVSALIRTALDFTAEDRNRYGFKTEIVLPKKPIFIMGDRIALESVFQNLAQNALRHAQTGKYLGIFVSISSKKHRDSPEMIIIKVQDKGSGISAREQKVVFEPFVRGRRAIDAQIPGNGIGLNLVKRIIAIHAGTITIESKVDEGCTFIVALPVCKGVFDAG